MGGPQAKSASGSAAGAVVLRGSLEGDALLQLGPWLAKATAMELWPGLSRGNVALSSERCHTRAGANLQDRLAPIDPVAPIALQVL